MTKDQVNSILLCFERLDLEAIGTPRLISHSKPTLLAARLQGMLNGWWDFLQDPHRMNFVAAGRGRVVAIQTF
jgi:hypothetical protein